MASGRPQSLREPPWHDLMILGVQAVLAGVTFGGTYQTSSLGVGPQEDTPEKDLFGVMILTARRFLARRNAQIMLLIRQSDATVTIPSVGCGRAAGVETSMNGLDDGSFVDVLIAVLLPRVAKFGSGRSSRKAIWPEHGRMRMALAKDQKLGELRHAPVSVAFNRPSPAATASPVQADADNNTMPGTATTIGHKHEYLSSVTRLLA
ncbi:hypothetical protein B0T11DRAFT_358742 [Plectosphaerella cucumerina]|uniref:Uncharacterized protein n=1 Tax=Plectosphaerella cucumerina TaxID=40658 RepID=A0A8K0X0N1_9PEZI|nr:hypothetical protein B0T11DRAFT_358742 [Plectosphaerella cucumerina]